MALSVIIITKNEEHNIRRCLESVQFADEIIVLDSGSIDGTVAIAREYTKQVFLTDWPGYGAQKQRALAKTTGDWVLNLDADETVSKPLQKELLQAIASDNADAYRIAIRMNFYNQPLKYSSSPKRHARLFKRKNAYFSTDIVHEKIILPEGARIGKLKNPIMHHSFKDVSHMLYKMNRYSSYSAKTYVAKKRKPSFVKILASTSWMFFRCYIVQRGFLDGKVGFLFAIYNAQGTFYRGVKQLYQDSNIEQLPNLAAINKD
jgi:glycosyltransferase involved in cell wall biosynthesis